MLVPRTFSSCTCRMDTRYSSKHMPMTSPRAAVPNAVDMAMSKNRERRVIVCPYRLHLVYDYSGMGKRESRRLANLFFLVVNQRKRHEQNRKPGACPYNRYQGRPKSWFPKDERGGQLKNGFRSAMDD